MLFAIITSLPTMDHESSWVLFRSFVSSLPSLLHLHVVLCNNFISINPSLELVSAFHKHISLISLSINRLRNAATCRHLDHPFRHICCPGWPHPQIYQHHLPSPKCDDGRRLPTIRRKPIALTSTHPRHHYSAVLTTGRDTSRDSSRDSSRLKRGSSRA